MYDNTELVRRVAHILTSRSGRAFLDGIGYVSGTPIVSADADERLVDVFRRMSAADAGMLLLAVHFPSRRRIAFLPISRGQSARACETLETDSTSRSTIGMLVDDISNRGTDVRVIVREVAERLGRVRVSECPDVPVSV